MEELKKLIVKNLENADFYKAINNIKKLESEFSEEKTFLFFYYFLYDFMQWVSNHKRDDRFKEINEKKRKYFNKINKLYQFDKSITYLKLYIFLDENFRIFDSYIWFRKNEKLIYLLDKSLEENSNNLETLFYLLYCKNKFKKCFEFLNNNILDIQLANDLLSRTWFDEKYIDEVQQLKKQYALNYDINDVRYNVEKGNYLWLYNYFKENEEAKNKNNHITFGKVCFELSKFNEAINFYTHKEDKDSNDYYILGQCYEKKGNKNKAINCYKNYYSNFQSGYFDRGIKKLFQLKAYNEIEDILKNEKSFHNREYKIFCEAKILNSRRKYNKSIEKLNLLKDYSKKDTYLLYISNYYNETIRILNNQYNDIIKHQGFELNSYYSIGYSHYSVYRDLEKYQEKLNIEFDNKYLKKTEQYQKRIHDKFILLLQKLYQETKKIKFELSEDRELYYLSAFTDSSSYNKRIKIYKKRVQEEPENPNYNLELGKLFCNKNNPTKHDIEESIKYLNKSIELAQKYFVYLNGEPELLLIKINKGTKKDNKQLFDNSMKNFIFHNSYQKDIQTTFFNQILYKYQSFSINALSSLSNNYLYFATPIQLNDPFDVASESLEKLFENLEIDKMDFKTCSLSKNNDNKLMWSHYTKDYTGICVGYKILYLPNYVGKDEVEYKNTNLKEKNIFKNILDYWIVKSEDWEYEKEVRLLHYGEQSKIKYTFDVQEAIEKNIIALYIESITLGMKFKEENILKQTISNIQEKQKRKISVFKARSQEQKLVIDKINL